MGEEHTYSVPGISCDACRNAIERAVGKLPGVTRIAVDVPGKLVRVRGEVSDDAIRAAIDEAGYEVAGIV
jgi:copper chaperone CopZ